MGTEPYPGYCVFLLNFDGLSALFEWTCLTDLKHVSRLSPCQCGLPTYADALWSLSHVHLRRDRILDRHPQPRLRMEKWGEALIRSLGREWGMEARGRPEVGVRVRGRARQGFPLDKHT